MATVIVGCAAPSAKVERRDVSGPPAEVLCGIDVLERDHFQILSGRRVALITNQSGRDRSGRTTVELLANAGNFRLICLFSPEHGLFGNVDEKVSDTTDPKTGLKVYSLYGKATRPTAQMLEGVDTLVFDIQDIGARFYTYSATLGICMEEAARHGLRFVVLDRPNPITGTIVDGPIADREHFGFTAYGPMPVAHGMTFGELAKLYKGAWGVNCDLVVVPMEGWQRRMWYDETGLTWINPSPNMRNLTAAVLYPAVCLLEATNISVGRGTDQPFERFGAPWIDGRKLSAELNAARLPGVRFVPIEFTPKESRFKDQRCEGVQMLLTDRNVFEPVRSGVTLAWTLRRLFGDQFQLDQVERLLQNVRAMDAIRTAGDPRQIQTVWQAELEKFKSDRRKYLLYE
ncbi:MAG: exo-beta-N-acetylmuramidase NamZ domain-containing protein [Tepidisphaerales bacterium]